MTGTVQGLSTLSYRQLPCLLIMFSEVKTLPWILVKGSGMIRASMVQWLRALNLIHWISHSCGSSLAWVHVRCQVLHQWVWWFLSGHSGFRQF